MKRHFCSIAVLLLFISLVHAQDSQNCTLIGRWADGQCYAVAVKDNIAYVGNGGYLEIVDFSNPANLVRLGWLLTPSVVEDIVVRGDYAYIANYKGGLRIINVSSSSNPVEVGSFVLSGKQAYRVKVIDNYAYVAYGSAGLYILDISNPSNPTLVGFFDTPGTARGVTVSGSYAYIADEAKGLRILNISDPAQPTEAGFFDTNGTAYGVALAGNYAYVADGGSLRIIDVSNPGIPIEMNSQNNSFWDITIAGNKAYGAIGYSGMCVLDITDPAHPVVQGAYNLGMYVGFGDKIITGNYVFLAARFGGLVLVDVANPQSPVKVGTYNTGDFSWDVAINENYAYIANSSSGMRVIDISDATHPTQVGFVDTPRAASGITYDNGYVYVADQTGGLRIIDVSNPISPIEVGFITSQSIAWKVIVVGNLAYLAESAAGLRIIDISNRSNPVQLGAITSVGGVHSVAVSGNYAFVAGYDSSLQVINISVPTTPTKVGSNKSSPFMEDIVVNNGWTYGACISGIGVYDISDPKHPTQVRLISLNMTFNVALYGNFLYAASRDKGLYIFDITDPSNPIQVGYCYTGFQAKHITARTDLVYLADGDDGLYIIRNDLYTTPVNKIMVTNTNDSGPGSLRQAILDAEANTEPDSVLFNIPDTDPGYDGTVGVWTIRSIEKCFRLEKGELIIDGFSQTRNQGNSNPHGPEIALDGRQMMVSPFDGFLITSGRNVISGMAIFGFKMRPFELYGQDVVGNHIYGNYIGVNAIGNDTIRNNYGIQISQGASNNIIGGSKANERNIISGSIDGITLIETTSNIVMGNFIGTDATGTFALGHKETGIVIGTDAKKNIIGGLTEGEGNLISANGWYGISIENDNADSNQVIGNKIGTDISGMYSLPNRWGGIRINGNAQYNQIGPGNVIKYNNQYGIVINKTTALYNRITQNSISNNVDGGIDLREGANNELSAPLIIMTNPVTGTTTPLAVVEIFSDSSNQGRIYEGSVMADGAGHFSWTGMPIGPNVTATVTDQLGNTSKFSNGYRVSINSDKMQIIPTEFSLMQNYPNPFNPITTISYQLPKSVSVKLFIYDITGRFVETLVNEAQSAGYHSIKWQADKLSSGIYFYRLEAGNFNCVKKIIVIK